MNLTWKARMIYAAAIVGAVVVGFLISDDEWIPLALVVMGLIGSALAAAFPVKLPRLLFSVLIFGYILGNRGFAQLAPTRGTPLFPAEIALAIGAGLLIIKSTAQRRLPLLYDRRNFALLVWIGLGAARIGFDVHTYGLEAIRDFAMVYYAGFFFLAQAAFEDESDPSRWLHRCLLIATALLLPLYILFDRFPDFFTQTLTFRDAPLIYYKGDLVGTNLTLGGLAWFIYYEQSRRRWWALVMSLVLIAAMLTTNNRSSLLALLVAAGWLGLGGRWLLLRTLVVGGILGALAIFFWGAFQGRSISDTPLASMYEEAASLLDPTGKGAYSAAGSFSKGDNNRFRVVWWRTVITDTVHTNPYIGLGFGYDLADEFLKVYYPDSNDDFRARSPHSIIVTVFARMGAIGLLGFLAFCAGLVNPTWQAVKRRDQPILAIPWCTGWAILTSACFGVVLEGPMGAVLFWSALGIGNVCLRRVPVEPTPVQFEENVEMPPLGARPFLLPPP